MLEIKKVSKVFNGGFRKESKTALNNVSINLEHGVYGFLGPNGAGKSTLMNIIVNILEPTKGEVLYNDVNIKTLNEKYRDILGYLPQDIGYYPNFTAIEFLEYIAHLKGISNVKTKVTEVLELVNLTSDAKRKVGGFSGGMKQRLGIAQALLNDPKILILDEPTAGLDPKERIRFRNIISKLGEDKIVILATHIVSDLDSIANKIILLKSGELIDIAKPDELLKQVKPFVWEVEDNFDYSNFIVSNIANGKVRIISETKPNEKAINITPNLEDVYLYYFGEQNVLNNITNKR